MGSVLSLVYNNPESSNLEEIAENDEFHDAIAEVDATENMNLAYSKNNEYLVTDAVESKFSHIPINTAKVTYETVADIEQELHYYEKVSLVFLLYDQEDNALQSLLVEHANIKRGSSTNLLYDWAKSKHLSTSSWQDRFVEALCVIQNYALIRRLGFDKEEMKSRYLPTQAYASLYLDKVMKCLYCLCEQLSTAEIAKLLEYLETDCKKMGISMEILKDFGENNLEIYLLHCLSSKYIRKNDLSNLIQILKNMGLVQKADMLESVLNMSGNNNCSEQSVKYNTVEKTNAKHDTAIINQNNRNFDLSKTVENYANPGEPPCSENSVIGDDSIVKNVLSSDCYYIDPDNVGICLIINQKKFNKDPVSTEDKLSFEEKMDYLEVPKHDLEERIGTDVDKASLSEIFKKLGFRVIVRENLNHRDMIPNIKEVMQTFSRKDSCFVVCVLSHGVQSKIYAANSVPISINRIRDTLHDKQFPALLSKPKILIIQSCQGTEIQKVYRPPPDDNETDGPSNNNETEYNLINDNEGVPEKRDFILCMSTVSGYASVRNRNDGTWYIQELCKTIDEKCEVDHFQDILIMVNNKVSNKRWEKKGQGIVTMVPEATTTLSKKLFLRMIKK